MVVSILRRRRRVGPISIGIVLALSAGFLLVASSAGAAPKFSGGGGISLTPETEAPPTTVPGRAFFPVRGPHQYWDGFGAGRGHQGVDVGARCGTPLVAVQAGKVRFAKYHPRAGNYVVIDLTGSELDLAYMHLSAPAPVEAGQSVAAGQPLGLVGDTGNASGCHLHFEVWQGPYYGGGAPIDPMSLLLSWDRELKKRPAARPHRH